jgi:hypothetical protein
MVSHSPKKEVRARKNLVDYFPEEHIVVAAGLVLLGVAILSIIPFPSSRALVYASAQTPASATIQSLPFFEALFYGLCALAFVFALVYAVNHLAKKI